MKKIKLRIVIGVMKKTLFDKLVFEQKLNDMKAWIMYKSRVGTFQLEETVGVSALINLTYQLSSYILEYFYLLKK